MEPTEIQGLLKEEPPTVTLDFSVEIRHTPDEGTPSPTIIDVYSALRKKFGSEIDIIVRKEN